MKRKISLLLVLALMISLVPMSVFAASDNSVDKTPQIKDDYKFNVQNQAPKLRVEEKNNNFGNNTAQTFRLNLENAKWLKDADLSWGSGFNADMGGTASYDPAGASKQMFFSRTSDRTVEVTVYGENDSAKDEEFFEIPLYAEADGKGPLKVTVDPRDSAVTGGTYTFATAADGDTIATIEDVEDFTDKVTIKDIQIDETKIGAIGASKTTDIKLKLPSDFKWINSETLATGTPGTSDDKVYIKLTGGLADATVSNIDIEDRTLTFDLTTSATTPETRGTIYIKNLQLTAQKDADFGEVEVSITGKEITSADLVIAKYSDYDVEIKADGDAKELIAGRKDSDSDDEHKLQTLVIKEGVANAWLSERKTRVEFPKWVKILQVNKESDTDNVNAITDMTVGTSLADQGDNYVEFFVDKADDAKTTELYLTFYVSVEAGHSGDITATVSGRSLGKETEVVLGKAIAPVEIKAEAADVRTGIKNQPIGKITITENKAEAIIKDKDIELVLGDGVEWKEVPTIKVTAGNLDLDVEGADVDGSVLTIPVDSDSSKPATIEITDVKLNLDRTIPEGDITVKVKGEAVVENYDIDKVDQETANTNDLKEGFFDEDTAAETVVARVITPADANTKAGQEVKFVIGNAEYQVGEEVKTADVAPYIKDGRTMLSVKYVAEAMGVPAENIIWDGATRTVTVFKGDRVAQMEIGSAKLMVNGTPVMMDTAAEIKDGRTCLPLSYVAKALGASVEWDGATRTVTLK